MRMRQDDSDRDIAKNGLMYRVNATCLRLLAHLHLAAAHVRLALGGGRPPGQRQFLPGIAR